MKTPYVFTIALALSAAPALAGLASDVAQQHIDAIASGDVAAITYTYTNSSTLRWVGGPCPATEVAWFI